MLIGRVLGTTELEADGARVDLGGPLPRRLVTALLAAEGRPVSESALTEAVWGANAPASPSVSVQAYVSRLRRSLGRDVLIRAGDGYRLAVDETDAARFAADLRRGRQLLDDERPGEALRAFETALARWRGEAFVDLPETYARTRLDELRKVAVEERLAARLATGDAPGAVGELAAAVRAEPYRERRWELLILGLYRSGRQAEALAELRRVRARLADDLGIDPGPALQELAGRLLAQDPRLLLPPARPAPAVRPLSTFFGRSGELAALAQLAGTELAEAGPAEAGPVKTEPTETGPTKTGPTKTGPTKTGPTKTGPTGNMPGGIGRSGTGAAAPRPGGPGRLVTLVGPGGAGKTRLAVEYAAGLDPWFVRLADVAEPDLVPTAVAAAVGVRGATVEAIVAALGGRPGLLLLDNCEHVIAAAAELTLELLARCPQLRVLATSREPLGVDGERLLPVAPLPAADAVALLTDRITAVRPGWRPDRAEAAHLAGLAAALDGIPLALELAAARARVLGLGELLDMLTGRFPALGPVPRGALAPHQTLEAAVAWSVDLLPAPDRALLLCLWPFEGGFPLSAVEADLDALSGLVARSVVVADTSVTPTRYRLLEIIRSYCRAHDPDPAGSRAAHAAWVRALVGQYAPQLRGERSSFSIRLLNRELANLRAGITHDLTAAPEAALHTAALLEWFWFRGGHVTDGLRLLGAALAGAPGAPTSDRARVIACMGTLRFISGDVDAADAHLRAAKAVLGDPADPAGEILAAQLGYYEALWWRANGEFEKAAESAHRSMALARAIGAEWIEPAAAMSLGAALVGAGRVADGREVLVRAGEHAVAVHQNWTAAMSELMLGRALLAGSAAAPPQPEAALVVLRRALNRFAEEDDVGNILSGLHTGAYALALAGRPADGAALLAAVRRTAARRGLDPDTTDPAGTAALEAALHGIDRAAAERAAADLDEAAMPALLGPAPQSGPEQSRL